MKPSTGGDRGDGVAFFLQGSNTEPVVQSFGVGVSATKSERCEAKKGWWTLGSRPCFTTPGNPRRISIPHTRPALRYGPDNS